MERCRDPARGVVGLAGEGFPVAQRAWVALGVGMTGEGDLAERLLRDAVVVHEARSVERALLRR